MVRVAVVHVRGKGMQLNPGQFPALEFNRSVAVYKPHLWTLRFNTISQIIGQTCGCVASSVLLYPNLLAFMLPERLQGALHVNPCHYD